MEDHVNNQPIVKNELSFNTQFLVTSGNVFSMDWNFLESFLEEMEKINVPVKIIKGLQEWGQDFIKLAYHINGSLKLNLVLRNSSDYIIDSIKKELNCQNIFIENVSENTNLYNLQKGGNYCVLPNTVYYNGISKNIVKLDENPDSSFAKYSNYLCLKIYDPNYNSENYYGDKVFHLDEIFTIIPTGYSENDYVIFFYKPVCDNLQFQNELLIVFEYNYNILQNVFGKEKIFLFDTHFTKGATFDSTHLVHPPLFNRLLIRKDDLFYIYFPYQEYITLVKLVGVLKSLNFDKIIYKFINTNTLHNLGGNLHCAFKAI